MQGKKRDKGENANAGGGRESSKINTCSQSARLAKKTTRYGSVRWNGK